MFFSVIIPTFKRRESLSLCLNHLAATAQHFPSDSYEVIVTDDALADMPADSLVEDFPWVRHLPGPQKGPASNRNNGARAARGDWLIFLDDDCLPQPTFLSAYREAIQKHPDHRVFEGSTLSERKQIRLDEEAPINEDGGYLWSCNFCIQQRLFSEMGGFCELYPYACMEDVDLREQLGERKIDFLFVPQASVIHPWRLMAPEDKFLNMLLVSHAIFYRRYPPRKPSFITSFRTVVRYWVLGLCWEAPSMGFRGAGRYFERQSTLSKFQFRVRQYEPEHPVEAVHRNRIPTRSSDA
jgi:glycosyltransferase involved in cell wall biosynthesis